MINWHSQIGDRVFDKKNDRRGTIIEHKQSGAVTVVFRVRWDDPCWDDSFRAA